MNPYNRAIIYTILTIVGIIFSAYSLVSNNRILLIVAVLFAIVSFDNIFCGFKKPIEAKKKKTNK